MNNDPKQTTLQPCPFCGQDTASVRSYQNGFRIGCDHCQALGPTHAHRAMAVALWNVVVRNKPKVGPSEFKDDELDTPERSVSGRLYFG